MDHNSMTEYQSFVVLMRKKKVKAMILQRKKEMENPKDTVTKKLRAQVNWHKKRGGKQMKTREFIFNLLRF